jgi:hypothetical protein
MGHWNHRIVRYKHSHGVSYGIAETFYNDKGEVCGYDTEPRVLADSVESLEEVLKRMLAVVENEDLPILIDGHVKFGEWDTGDDEDE